MKGVRALIKSNERTPDEHDHDGEDLLPRCVGRDVTEADGGEGGAVFYFIIFIMTTVRARVNLSGPKNIFSQNIGKF